MVPWLLHGDRCAQIVSEDTPKLLKVFEDDFITEATIQQGLEHDNVVT